jgi:hypothetical protein
VATLLTKIRRTPDRRTTVTYDVGRTLGLVVVAVVAIAGAVALWLADKNSAAYIVFSLGEAVVVGGLGVAYGERRGAVAAGADPVDSASEE